MSPLEKLISVLHLKKKGPFIYEGEPIDLGFPRLFGGHVLAQALYASAQELPDRRVHSLHAYFIRPGNIKDPLTYEVEPIRDGKSFTTRRVKVSQSGKVIFSMSSSFQVEESGFEHQISMPYVPPPEGVDSDLDHTREFAHLIPKMIREKVTSDQAIEMRTIDLIHPFEPKVRQPEKNAWVRANGKVPNDPLIHECLLAYASDFSLLGTSIRPHGVSIIQKHMQVASLDHAMWFHRKISIDDWTLYTMDSPSASGARGFNRGNFFSKDGVLMASVTQEGLIRDRS